MNNLKKTGFGFCMAIASFLLFSPSFLMAQVPGAPSTLAPLPDASWNHLPRWRGFTLLSMFCLEQDNGPFLEDDFRMISELGFNYVRIPLDYRFWIKNGDWNQMDENVLKKIDQVVEWGGKYNLHVCLDLHRAPGYCTNKPYETTDLWTDPSPQAACAKMWAMFAKRYKGISNSRLSFELINEPLTSSEEAYVKVATMLVDAIRKEDPQRLILADGTDYARAPVEGLIPLHVAEEAHVYDPFGITHYHADWIPGAMTWPLPQWPSPIVTSYIYGPLKAEFKAPWVVEGTFDKPSDLRLHIQKVSVLSEIQILADGKVIFDKKLDPGPLGKGEWKESEFMKEWNLYQALFDKDYTAQLPPHTRQIDIEIPSGEWISFSELEIKPHDGGKPILIRPSSQDWGQKAATLYLTSEGYPDPDKNTAIEGKDWLWKKDVAPWLRLQSGGIAVFMGEWGVYNQTPHDVTLRWMKDSLQNFKDAGWGWALWNFRGVFGVMDSGRKDVKYENFEGHKLDREMMNLLQTY
jgi:aryl-phospho-beta-D-glucosidase BglC (GH1 family)